MVGASLLAKASAARPLFVGRALADSYLTALLVFISTTAFKLKTAF
ncbi:hypothetical protein PTUN_b0108 [Pseudoalteromonas tunicata]|uniref:Uncharacterized protein n=1 Tax=Pseudoalteromonas tunicata D2 TaxID=87626 RepID=A4C3M4_9GAMM|nr:hypothetical protein PTUN_b0108 [Pseudoalteromonas tunicata]EAR30156.1 hypothetical protein PTD2_01266 [Pseudoalteromonas tunicata D2]